jgi:hypothetical protein
VLRDVVIHRIGPYELLAVSQAPGLAGEEMSLDLTGGGANLGLRVRVIDSAPMIFNGSVRHRIRLAVLNGASASAAGDELPATLVANRPAAAEM